MNERVPACIQVICKMSRTSPPRRSDGQTLFSYPSFASVIQVQECE